MAKQPRMAQDRASGAMQFSELATTEYTNLTTAAVYDADKDQYVRIKPTGSAAWVQVASSATTPVSGEGALVDSEITIVIPAGYYIGASAEINIVPWGRAE